MIFARRGEETDYFKWGSGVCTKKYCAARGSISRASARPVAAGRKVLRGSYWPVHEILAPWPLIHHDSEIVELLDDGFDVAPKLWSIALVCTGRLGDSYDAAIVPGAGRESDKRFRPVSYTHLDVYKRQGLEGPSPGIRPG